MTEPDDETASMLRDVLRRQADAVHPSEDGPARILAATSGSMAPARSSGRSGRVGRPDGMGRTGRTGRVGRTGRATRPLPRWVPVLAAAATVALLAAGLGAVRMGLIGTAGLARLTGATPAGQIPRVPTGPPPLPVYFVQHQGGRWALVREFEPTTATTQDARLDEALRLAVRGKTGDPDLTSVWAVLGLSGDVAATIDAATIDAATMDDTTVGAGATAGAGRVTVRLSRPLLGVGVMSTLTRTTDLPPAGLAVQQLVWTATAVTGTSGPVALDGTDTVTPLFGTLPLGRAYARAGGKDDARAPVWISSISDGQRLVMGTAMIRGDAVTTTGGTVNWSLTGPDGTVAGSGAAALIHEDGTPARVGERAAWQLRINLPTPGRYLLQVSQPWPDAPADTPPWTDTKNLHVVPRE